MDLLNQKSVQSGAVATSYYGGLVVKLRVAADVGG